MPKHLIAIEPVATLPADPSLYEEGYPVYLSTDGLIYLADPVTPAWNPAGVAGLNPDVVTINPSGATPNLDFDAGSAFDVTLNQAATFTFSNAVAGKAYTLRLALRQNATGGHAVTFPTGIHWAGGTVPTLTTTAGAVDLLEFTTFDGGVTWFGIVLVLNADEAAVFEAFDIRNPAYATQSLDMSATDTAITGIYLSPDGTKLFIAADTGNTIRRYDLSTAFNVTTATLNAGLLDVSTQANDPFHGVDLSDDGLNLYIIEDGVMGREIHWYTLATAWDLSTGTFADTLAVGDTDPRGVRIAGDGSRVYSIGLVNDTIEQFPLSTPYDTTTAGAATTFNYSAQVSTPQGFCFSPDGTKLFIVDGGNDRVFRYDLSTAWDVTTATFSMRTPLTHTIDPPALTNATDVEINDAGDFMLLLQSNIVYAFDLLLPTEDPSIIASASASGITQDTSGWDAQTSKALWFSPDGTKLFFTGSQSVERVDLATAWDITSGTLNASILDVSAQNSNTRGVWLSDDGTQVFVSCQTDQEVLQYTLSTAFDLSTATFVGAFLTTGSALMDCWVSDDGTKLFISDQNGRKILQYTLTTAFNVTTAGTLVSYDLTTASSFFSPSGLYFSDGGTEFFVHNGDNSQVYHFVLGTAWDVTTATLKDASPTLGGSNALFIKPDNTKLWLHNNNSIVEYNL